VDLITHRLSMVTSRPINWCMKAAHSRAGTTSRRHHLHPRHPTATLPRTATATTWRLAQPIFCDILSTRLDLAGPATPLASRGGLTASLVCQRCGGWALGDRSAPYFAFARDHGAASANMTLEDIDMRQA